MNGGYRFQGNRGQLERFYGLLPENQGQNLAVTVLYVPYSLDSGERIYASALEATQGQMDGFFSQLQYKCHLEEVASVGDRLKICPQLDSRVGNRRIQGVTEQCGRARPEAQSIGASDPPTLAINHSH